MELERIKSNVSKMVEQGAPESDIDAYIQAEGTTVDAVKAYKAPKADKPWNEDVADFLRKQSRPDSELGAFFGGAGQGITLGRSDEMAAAMGIGNREQNQQRLAQAQEKNPNAYGIGEVGGAVAGAMVPMGIAGKIAPELIGSLARTAGKSATRQIGTSGAIGALSGGTYAYNTGDGTGEERLERAPKGAALGALGGIAGASAVPLAAKLASPVSSLAERAKRLFSKAEVKPMTPDMVAEGGAAPMIGTAAEQDKAMSLLADAINKDFGPDAPSVMAAIKDGNITLGEIAKAPNRPNVRGLIVGAAQYPKGKTVVEQALTTEMGDRGARVSESMGRNIADFGGFYGTMDDIVSKGQAKAAPLYEKAYGDTVNDTSVLLVPEIADAVNRGISKYQSALKGYPANSIAVLDHAKKVLDADIEAAKRAGDRGLVKDRTAIKKRLTEVMDQASPSYAEARKTAGDYLSVESAMEEGTKILNTRPELVKKAFNSFESEAEKQAYKMGFVESLRKELDSMGETVDPYQRIMQKDGNKQRLGAILSPSEYRAFEKDLKAEQRLFRLYKDALAGTQTTPRAKAAQAFEAVDGVADVVLGGGPKAAVKMALKDKFKGWRQGLSDNVAGILADAVYETNPSKKLAIVQSLKPKPGVMSSEEVKEAKRALAEVEKALRKKRLNASASVGGGVVAAPEQEKLKITVRPSDNPERKPKVDLPTME